MEHYGAISLIPALTVLVLALITKRAFEALVGGTLLGFIIVNKGNFFSGFADSALKVMADATIGWIIMVCGLFGSLIALLVKSGGALAFGEFLMRFVKNSKASLIATWFLGLVIFIDDYLNALTVSSAMQKVTDKFRVSREMLSYVVDSTSAPVCILVPFSTWAIFVSGLLEESGAADKGAGLDAYINAIPYMFYGWAAMLMVPLVVMGIVPLVGAMKKAETRARQTGQVIPPGSESLTMGESEVAATAEKSPKLYNFLIPIILLIGCTWYFNVDAFKGVLIATAVSMVMFWVQRIMTLEEIFETFFVGFKSMIYPLAIVVVSFMLKNVNDSLGLTNYVIESVKPIMSGALLPVVTFIALSLVTFATGTFWGVYAVALPIVIPLAQAMDVSLPLAIGAVISSGAFGSHSCFYGDATVLSATGSGCSAMDHALTQLPYAILSAIIAAAAFLVAGLMMG